MQKQWSEVKLIFVAIFYVLQFSMTFCNSSEKDETIFYYEVLSTVTVPQKSDYLVTYYN